VLFSAFILFKSVLRAAIIISVISCGITSVLSIIPSFNNSFTNLIVKKLISSLVLITSLSQPIKNSTFVFKAAANFFKMSIDTFLILPDSYLWAVDSDSPIKFPSSLIVKSFFFLPLNMLFPISALLLILYTSFILFYHYIYIVL